MTSEGAGEFTDDVFQSAVSAVQPFYRRGAIKGVKHMKGKWQSVSFIYSLLIKLSLTSHKLQLIHMAINVWRGISGVHWDNKDECGIVPEMEKVWQEHFKGVVSMIFSALFFSDHIFSPMNI